MSKPQNKGFDIHGCGWTMFSTSQEEIDELFVSLGNFTIGPGYIIVEDYPFQPSIAFKNKKLEAGDIVNIDLKTAPPTVRIGDELVFVPAKIGKSNLQNLQLPITFQLSKELMFGTGFWSLSWTPNIQTQRING